MEMEMPHSSVVKELYDLEDFKSISTSDGLISIGGYGSLLSEKSARLTFPDLQNFRVARIFGFRRVFHVASPFFVQNGYSSPGAKDIAAVSAEPYDGQVTIITVFEIHLSNVPAFLRRENAYRFLAVFPETLDGAPYSKSVVICLTSTDEDYHKRVCKGSEEEFFNRYGQYGIDRVWSNDILPNAAYLRLCVLAAKNLGNEVYENFIDNTYLGDKKTTIRQYLHDHPYIMEEKPTTVLVDCSQG